MSPVNARIRAEPEDTRDRQTAWEFVFGVLFTVMVLVVVLMTAMALKNYYYDSNYLPVDTISVKGTVDQKSVEEISSLLVSSGVLSNFVRLDVDDVQELVQGYPWVQSVAVRKQWPSYLYLRVVEKIPVARWGKDEFYSPNAGVFKGPSVRGYGDLVSISGPADRADEIYENYRKYQRRLALKGLLVDSVSVSDRMAWEICLKNGPRLILGRGDDDIDARLGRFLKVFGSIANREMISYIDLRYDNGMAVGWKTGAADAK